MNGWIKRGAGAFAAIVLLAVVIAGCGSAAGGAKGSGKAEPASGSASAKQTTIRIGTNASFYPYVFKDTADGELKGYEVDIWKELAQRLDLQIEWKIIDFASLFGALEAGQIDTVANSIATTEERKAKYAFAEPYVYSGARLVVKKGNDQIRGLTDLFGKKIGIQVGSPTFNKYVKSADPDGRIEIVNYETAEGGFTDVALGRIDATFTTTAAGLAYIKKTGQPLQLVEQLFTVIPAGSPFVRNDANAALIARIDEALAALRKEGKLSELSLKWYGEDLSVPADAKKEQASKG